MSYKHAPYSKITNFIYIGTNECCQKKEFAKKLLKKGIKADISLEEKRIDTPFGIKYYLWLPVKDHMSPGPLQFKIGISMIEQLVKAKKKVYVHCRKGHGRAPTLVVAYLITQGMELKQAVDFVKSKRSEIHFRSVQKTALSKIKKIKFNN